MTSAPPQLSAGSRAHIDEVPLVRRSIAETVAAFAAELAPGTRVLDAGAGNAPYAELFAHCDYRTADWPQSVHEQAGRSDIVASLEALPVADGCFDAIVCTEVLEHVARPAQILDEFLRVLIPGGRLCLTVPFVWPLHEEPFDFYRFTPHSLTYLLESAGFVELSVQPRAGYLTTLAQMAGMTRWLSVTPGSERASARTRLSIRLIRLCGAAISRVVRGQPVLDDLATGVQLPLGYRALARKPM